MAIIIFLILIPTAIYSGIAAYGFGYRCADILRDGHRNPEEVSRREKDFGYVAMFRQRKV